MPVALLGHTAAAHRSRPRLVQAAASAKGVGSVTQSVVMDHPITDGNALILLVAAPLNYGNHVEISGDRTKPVWLMGLSTDQWQVDYYRAYEAVNAGTALTLTYRKSDAETIAQVSEWTGLGPSTVNEADFGGAYNVQAGRSSIADTGAATAYYLPSQGGLCLGHCLRRAQSAPATGPTNGWSPLLETVGAGEFQLSSAYNVQVNAAVVPHSTQWTLAFPTTWSAGFLMLRSARR